MSSFMSSSRSTHRHATELADAALNHPPGTALVCELGRSPAVLAATPHRYGALVGLSCPVTIDAVAASHEAVLSVNGRRRDVMLGVAVMRAGPPRRTIPCGPGRAMHPPRAHRTAGRRRSPRPGPGHATV